MSIYAHNTRHIHCYVHNYIIIVTGTLFGGKFPLEMDAIYAPVVAEDVDGDGEIGKRG